MQVQDALFLPNSGKYASSDLAIIPGASVFYPFVLNRMERVWNGRIFYSSGMQEKEFLLDQECRPSQIPSMLPSFNPSITLKPSFGPRYRNATFETSSVTPSITPMKETSEVPSYFRYIVNSSTSIYMSTTGVSITDVTPNSLTALGAVTTDFYINATDLFWVTETNVFIANDDVFVLTYDGERFLQGDDSIMFLFEIETTSSDITPVTLYLVDYLSTNIMLFTDLMRDSDPAFSGLIGLQIDSAPSSSPSLLEPSSKPSSTPSIDPTQSFGPTLEPTSKLSITPSTDPTQSVGPTLEPTSKPSITPSTDPTQSYQPSNKESISKSVLGVVGAVAGAASSAASVSSL